MRQVAKHAVALAVGALVGGLAFAADAATPHKRTTAPGEIIGVWMVQPPYYLAATLSPEPTLTPQAQAQSARFAAAVANGYVRTAANMLCGGVGGPALAIRRAPFEVVQGFGRVSFIFETDVFNQPRTVYLREKVQPPNIFPSENGHSIGHWEGKVLVVDTVGFDGRSLLPGASRIAISEQAHIVERFSVSRDGKVLTDEMTVTDPAYLVRPWTTALKFDRQPDTEERFQVACEPDLDALKTLDLKALKDADPFVARLVDPDRRPTDPALKIAKPGS